MRLSIPGRVFAAFLALLITFGGVSLFNIIQVQNLEQQVARLHASLLPMPGIVSNLRSELSGLALTLDQEDPAALRRAVRVATRVHPYLERMDQDFERARTLLKGADEAVGAGLTNEFSRMYRAFSELQDETRRFFAAVQADRDDPAEQRALGRQLDNLGRDLDRFRVQIQQAVDRAVTRSTRHSQRVVWAAIALASIAMIIGVAVTFSANRLLRPLRALRAGVHRLAEGKYAERVHIGDAGELGALADDFNKMAEAIERRDAQLVEQQAALLHRERLVTVGRLSAQITHELRNPLSSIGLNSELLMEEIELEYAPGRDAEPDLDGARGLLKNIILEVERLKEITEEYLQFARLPRPEPRAVDLNHAAAELLEFTRTEMEHAGVRTRLDADPSALPAWVDPNQLRAALLNLLRNAREALETQGGGHIVLRSRSLGAEATLEVIDDGPGLEDEPLARVFEPFYSTKPQGTGLGLPMVQQIIQAQGGNVEIDTAPSRGLTARIRLPLASGRRGLHEGPSEGSVG